MVSELYVVVQIHLPLGLLEVLDPPLVLLGCLIAFSESTQVLLELCVARRDCLPLKVEIARAILICETLAHVMNSCQ
jgi:hypothetical protein